MSTLNCTNCGTGWNFPTARTSALWGGAGVLAGLMILALLAI